MKRSWPRGTCPRCGRLMAGRMRDDGRLTLRNHLRARKGSKEADHGPAIPCAGSGAITAVVGSWVNWKVTTRAERAPAYAECDSCGYLGDDGDADVTRTPVRTVARRHAAEHPGHQVRVTGTVRVTVYERGR